MKAEKIGILLGKETHMMARLNRWILEQNRRDSECQKNLKRAIGILGMWLPAICVIGGIFSGYGAQNSVSLYYYTNMRDVLVAILGCASIFFMTYSGYGTIDDVITWVIGIAGAGVVIFPCASNPKTPAELVGVLQVAQSTSDTIHIACAIVFFLFLAINSMFLFTLSDMPQPRQRKRLRNAIYWASGLVILASLVTLVIVGLAARHFSDSSHIQLVFEFIMLFAFGVAWLVKSDVPYFRD